ncbi:MAG: hypothetical protein QFB86_01105 [Patescibacteria group bacterium]|nr:hypothetical protein [Patescibacteria group bacterium]
MTPVIILAALVLVPAIVLTVLRVHGALVFLSLCLGAVLMQFASADVTTLTQIFSAHNPNAPTDSNTIKIALLSLPAVLTILFMIRTVKGKGRLVLNILPALGVGVLAALLIVPLLPESLRTDIMNTTYWNQGQQAQGYIVGLTATVSLLTVWMQRPKHHRDDKHGKHK